MVIHKSSDGQLHMGPSYFNLVDLSERVIVYKVSQRKSTRKTWERTRENMRMSDKEAICRHDNEWAAKAACEQKRLRKSTREIDPPWDRTRENYAVMRMPVKEASRWQSIARFLSRASHVLSHSQRQLALGQQQ